VVSSEQGRLLIIDKVLTFFTYLAGIVPVRWNSPGNLRHDECAVEKMASNCTVLPLYINKFKNENGF